MGLHALTKPVFGADGPTYVVLASRFLAEELPTNE
jgi:hypothetical protein